jgi:Flp pilus assembly protein TadG
MIILRQLGCDRRGIAAVEFAVFAQIFALLFAGVADVGIVLMKRIQLNDTLAAAANYAIVNQVNVSSVNGAALATTLTTIIAGIPGAAYADASVTINNGPQRQSTTGVVTTPVSIAANADQCYCPTKTTTIVWGTTVTCGNACTSGLRAGKFVLLTASKPHTPLFSNYGIVKAGAITVTTLVQTS